MDAISGNSQMRLEYLVKRILLLILIVWAAATLNFFLPRMTGGDPIRSRMLQVAATGGAVQTGMEQMVEVYQERFGLNDPLHEQYFAYLKQISRFDLGYSMTSYPATVWDVMAKASVTFSVSCQAQTNAWVASCSGFHLILP